MHRVLYSIELSIVLNTVMHVFYIRKYTASFIDDVLLSYKPWDEIKIIV